MCIILTYTSDKFLSCEIARGEENKALRKDQTRPRPFNDSSAHARRSDKRSIVVVNVAMEAREFTLWMSFCGARLAN